MCHCVQWQLKSVVGQSNVVISVAKQLLRVFDKDFLGSGPNSFFFSSYSFLLCCC
jgi:hypothetical protein